MLRVDWLRSLSGSCHRLSRRQRRVLASRRRRLGSPPVPAVQRLEDRTLLAAPNPLDLNSLDGTTGFRLDGVSADDQSGLSVSSAGDVNGDGFEDVIVGARFADPDGTAHGASYVVFGRSGGFASVIDLSALNGTNGFRLDGIGVDDYTGRSVSSAGDVNGDGFDDLVIGANGANSGGSDSGAAYVLFGRSAAFTSVIDLSALNGTTGFRIDGAAAGDQLGRYASGAGDVNGDGFDDLIIGASHASPNGNLSGSSFVLFGRSGGFASVIDLNTLDGTTGFRLDGIAASDVTGWSVGAAGDINGDGFDDVIIGAPLADSNALNSGSAYVLFGGGGGFASVIDLSALNGTTGFRLDGEDSDDRAGFSVSGAGDIDGDGLDDFIVGAFRNDPGGNLSAGSSYVVFGSTTAFASVVDLTSLNGTTGFRLDGEAAYDYSGVSVSGAGDVNGDGFDDLILGAYGADNSGSDSGSGYVLFGRSSSFSGVVNLSTLNGSNGFRLDGDLAGDDTGRSVSSAGDVNGDGFDDLILGARRADANGSSSGSSYVIFGGNFTGGAETQVGGDGSQTLNATLGAGVDILIGGRGDDTLVSDGGDDVLRGGEGDDILAIPDVNFSPRRLLGGTGTDTLRLDGAGLTLDLRLIADNRITGIEQIDLNDNDNRLILTPREVLRLSGSTNTLTIRGGSDDRLVVADGSWSLQGIVNIDGTNYKQYASGAATLNIEVGLAATFAVQSLSTLDGTTGFVLTGIDPDDRSGRSVSSAGDVNGDGFDDLIIGATGADQAGGGEGESYVVFGRSGGFASSIELSSLDGTTGFVLTGIDPGDYSGRVSSAGDVNGDGFDDLIVGATGADQAGGFSHGETYVVFGRSGGFASSIALSSLDGTTGFVLTGIDPSDYSGVSVSSAGDVNGDGFDDLIIGATGADQAGGVDHGETYVVFGQSGGFASSIEFSSLDGTTGFVLTGIDAGDDSGFSVSSAGTSTATASTI